MHGDRRRRLLPRRRAACGGSEAMAGPGRPDASPGGRASPGAPLLVGYVAFPLLWLARLSILPETLLIELPPVWLFTPSLSGYREVLTLHPFARYLQNSLVVAVCSSAGGDRAGLAGRVQLRAVPVSRAGVPVPGGPVRARHAADRDDHPALRDLLPAGPPRHPARPHRHPHLPDAPAERVASAGVRAAGARGAGGGRPGGRLRPARGPVARGDSHHGAGDRGDRGPDVPLLVERLHLRGDPDGPRARGRCRS